MNPLRSIPLTGYPARSIDELQQRSRRFCDQMQRRRTVRDFSSTPVPRAVIAECVRAAATAPSGANMQPWHFVIVGDADVKRRIRVAAETEEQDFYTKRAPKEWLQALAPLGTNPDKPFLEIAPWLIAIFVQRHGLSADGTRFKHYYASESVGIATGMLITALHHAGLATLTHTPAPMGFLKEILGRPERERPFMILVAGFPAADAKVPDIEKKPFEEIVTFV